MYNNGNLLWARQCNSTSSAGGNGISSDDIGNCFLTGRFNGIADFGSDTLISEAGKDMFLARYNPSGDCMGAVHFGYAEGNSVGQDLEGNPYVVGQFSGTVNIGEFIFTKTGFVDDIFIAKCEKITGIYDKKFSKNNQLLIYANPNEGMCSITIPEDLKHEQYLSLFIYNTQGKLIQKALIEIEGERISLNISAEAAGMYNVILSNGKKNYTGKIIFK